MKWRRRLREEESGFTLIELLVAMSIFSILLAVFISGVARMSKETVRVQNTGDNANDIRRSFALLDKQIRYASDVNMPTKVGNNWYVEWRTSAQPAAGSAAKCTQWRLNTTTDLLDYRTWVDSATPGTPSWNVAGTHVVNSVTTEPPFTVALADQTHTHMQVGVSLRVQRGASTATSLQSTYVARNTTTNVATTPTNAAVGGVTTSPVCTALGRP